MSSLHVPIGARLTVEGFGEEPVDGHEAVLRVILHHGLLQVSPVQLGHPE